MLVHRISLKKNVRKLSSAKKKMQKLVIKRANVQRKLKRKNVLSHVIKNKNPLDKTKKVPEQFFPELFCFKLLTLPKNEPNSRRIARFMDIIINTKFLNNKFLLLVNISL